MPPPADRTVTPQILMLNSTVLSSVRPGLLGIPEHAHAEPSVEDAMAVDSGATLLQLAMLRNYAVHDCKLSHANEPGRRLLLLVSPGWTATAWCAKTGTVTGPTHCPGCTALN